MDIEKLLLSESRRLKSEARKAAEYGHPGLVGRAREHNLRSVFQASRLFPAKYEFGTGIVANAVGRHSKETDLVIYDANECPNFLKDEDAGIFPADGVYGVITVKSAMGSTEFNNALLNIKSFKQLLDENAFIPGTKTATGPRPLNMRPFGAIFAYGLKDNSLNSLKLNLEQFEASVDRKYWPNIVAVLEEGMLVHTISGTAHEVLTSGDILCSGGLRISTKGYGAGTLFRFYLALYELARSVTVQGVDVEQYARGATQLGDHIVSGMYRWPIDDGYTLCSLTETFIDELISWCGTHATPTLGTILEAKYLRSNYKSLITSPRPIRLYDPDGMLSPDDFNEATEFFPGEPPARTLASALRLIMVDGQVYAVPKQYCAGLNVQHVRA